MTRFKVQGSKFKVGAPEAERFFCTRQEDENHVILSEAKDLGSLQEGTKDEILRFAQDDKHLMFQ